ncbi:MAG TPA: hypothetical protein VHB98_16020 [Chloroflexota bacterium]|nr:hypothetical protein [Chloroflexota bacterium]
MEQRVLRAVTILFGIAGLVFGIGFLAQAPWATGLWPWLDTGYVGDPQLSYIFRASICAAIARPCCGSASPAS